MWRKDKPATRGGRLNVVRDGGTQSDPTGAPRPEASGSQVDRSGVDLDDTDLTVLAW
ncbi:MAG: hypothetical protein JWR32_4037 [Mycobacterium sp.]|jgi:hypothetical protein|nr:hypothetical protein [Mycobacterium sp.]